MAVQLQKASMDGNLAATYTYIYSFLVKREHHKVAESLKKAVKNVVVLKDGVQSDSPPLDVIVREWKELKEKAAANESSDSSDSDSDSKSGSESSSESSSSSSGSDSSDSDSDSDSDSSSCKPNHPPSIIAWPRPDRTHWARISVFIFIYLVCQLVQLELRRGEADSYQVCRYRIRKSEACLVRTIEQDTFHR
ncbi:hypothetical protein BD414DRAFT_316917 [Trametes punicea]|nr:hypothetical protein BD414DRAFT_316917 [Trametes punicea]